MKDKLSKFFKKAGKKIKSIWESCVKKLTALYKDNTLLKVYSVVIVVVILLFLIASSLIGGDTSVVKKYAKGLINSNPDKIYATINSNYVKAVEKSSKTDVLAFIKKKVNANDSAGLDYVSYEIVDSYVLTELEVKELTDKMKIFAPNFDTKKIKKCKRYQVKYKIKKDGAYKYDYDSIYIMKVGFSWSVVYNN